MKSTKKYLPLLIIVIVGLAGIFFFLYHFGHNDEKAVTEFSLAYKNYEKAISDLAAADLMSGYTDTPSSDELVLNANDALLQLKLKASARISSLTRHDAELMSTAQEVADLSTKEFDLLNAYRMARINKEADQAQISKELQDLTVNRQAAYARYQELVDR